MDLNTNRHDDACTQGLQKSGVTMPVDLYKSVVPAQVLALVCNELNFHPFNYNPYI